jgi:hypothetical protein
MLVKKKSLRKVKNIDILRDRNTSATLKLIKLANKVGKLK